MGPRVHRYRRQRGGGRQSKPRSLQWRDGFAPIPCHPSGDQAEYPLHSWPKHLKWDCQSVKGFVYIVTDRGSLRHWLKLLAEGKMIDGTSAPSRTRNMCLDTPWWQTVKEGRRSRFGQTRSGAKQWRFSLHKCTPLFLFLALIRRGEQRPAPGKDNLHVGAVSRLG